MSNILVVPDFPPKFPSAPSFSTLTKSSPKLHPNRFEKLCELSL